MQGRNQRGAGGRPPSLYKAIFSTMDGAPYYKFLVTTLKL